LSLQEISDLSQANSNKLGSHPLSSHKTYSSAIRVEGFYGTIIDNATTTSLTSVNARTVIVCALVLVTMHLMMAAAHIEMKDPRLIKGAYMGNAT